MGFGDIKAKTRKMREELAKQRVKGRVVVLAAGTALN